MSLSTQNSMLSQALPQLPRAPEPSRSSGPNLESVDYTQASLPKINSLSIPKMDVGHVDLAQVLLPKSPAGASSEGPGLASTIGQQVNDEISKLWREKRSEGGFVQLAKFLGKFLKSLIVN